MCCTIIATKLQGLANFWKMWKLDVAGGLVYRFIKLTKVNKKVRVIHYIYKVSTQQILLLTTYLILLLVVPHHLLEMLNFFFQKLHTCFTSDSHELFCNHNSNIFIFSTSNIRGQASLKIYGSIIAATFVRTFNKYRQWLWWEKHTVMNSSYSRYTFVGFVYGLAPVKKNAGNFKFNFFLFWYATSTR